MNVLSIGAGIEQLSSIKIAKKLGLKVISCDGDKNAIGQKESFKFYNIDIKDENQIINIAKKHNISFIIPSPLGRYLTTVGAINDEMSLKGITKKAAILCTDKLTFHKILKNHINLAKQFLVKSDKVLLSILDNDISAPFILKPRFGSGSRGVQVFKEKNISSIKKYFKDNDYGDILLEEFILGDEIGVDAIVRDSIVEIIAIRDKTITQLPYRQELAYTLPSKYESIRSKIQRLLTKAVSLLEINNSLINFDAIINNNEIYLIELAPRASGNKISETILPIALNINPLAIFMQFLIGKNIPLETTISPTLFHFFNFNQVGNNKIINIKPFKPIETLMEYNCNLKVGNKVRKICNGTDALYNGYFILQGDIKKMQADCKKIHTHFEFSGNINENNKKSWSNVIQKNIMLYPDTAIVSFLARNFNDTEKNKTKKALDIGFGSGRHLKLLEDYGFDIYGIDYSKEACDTAKELFSLQESIACKDLGDKPFNSKKFDTIVAFGVIFLKPMADMKVDLTTIYEALNKNGEMIINFRTKDDFLYKDGKQIDKNTFILDNPIYKDMCYTFLNKDEAVKLLTDTGFKVSNISKIEYHKNNLTEHHSWWIFEVIKN